jgi:hypothetical protein
MKFLKSSFFLLFASLVAAHAAPITWNGAGDGSNFNNPGNWIGNVVPGASDDAIITSGAGTQVIVTTTTTVLSVQCSKAFSVSAGNFTVTAGSSQINGAFFLASYSYLYASGAGTTFTVNGPTTVDDANFTVSAGAVVTLPNLTNYTKACVGANWLVTGANSVLNLPVLTNITGQACTFPTIQAAAGGQVLIPKLATVTAGPLGFAADGVGSLIDLSGLSNCTGVNPNYSITFEASAGGTIQMPLMTGGAQVGLILNPGGNLPLAQIRQLYSITANGVTNSFPGLTNMDGGAFTIQNGASVRLPVLRNYTVICGGENDDWMVTGANSVLNLPGLTNITGSTCIIPTIQTQAGGVIILTNVTTILAGDLNFLADGAGSLIDLSALASVPLVAQVNFEASAGGTIRMPLMPGNPLISMTINAGGSISTASLKQLLQLTTFVPSNFNALTNLSGTAGLTVNGATNSFPALANFDDQNISVLNGGSVTLPALRNYTKACQGANWLVTGANSVLNLPVLTNITGQACSFPTIQAAAGGIIIMTNLATIVAGPLAFNADGASSLIDLNALVSVSGQDPYPVTFEASAGGTIAAAKFTGGSFVGVTLNSGGNLPLAQFRQLYSITANNGAVANLPALTNLDGGSLSATAGGQINLPVLQVVNPLLICDVAPIWEATGAGSQINAPALATFVGSSCQVDTIEALAGGQVTLSNLTVLNGPQIKVLADGAGSVIDLSRMSTFLSANPVASTLTAQNSGVILLRTQALLLQNINITTWPGNSAVPPYTNSGGSNLTLYGIPWHSYLVQQMDTTIPGALWQFFTYVPLTNAFQEISAVSPANLIFRGTDFVADPPLLTLAPVPDVDVQMVLYGATNKTYEIQSATNLTKTTLWASNAVAVMTNAFRIFPPVVADQPKTFLRAKQIAP